MAIAYSERERDAENLEKREVRSHNKLNKVR